jgi:hypothetical protein
MNDISLSLRSAVLILLTLAAIGHADSDARLATLQPRISGLGRLGRDLVRRTSADEVGEFNHHYDPLPILPTSSG